MSSAGASAGSWIVQTEPIRSRQQAEVFQRFHNIQARILAERAITIDPNFAGAQVLIGWTYFIELLNGWAKDPALASTRAVEAASKTVALDETYGSAHGLLAWINLISGGQKEAIAAAGKAVQLEPAGADVASTYSEVLVMAGRADEAIEWFNRSKRHDPNTGPWKYWSLSEAYRQLGRYQEMIAVANGMQKEIPEYWWETPRLVFAYMKLGREDEARAELK
jgi:adenylate cyclase